MVEERAARGAGIGSGVAFEDGDGVAMAVQDTGEGKAAGITPDQYDTPSQIGTSYRFETAYRNSTMPL